MCMTTPELEAASTARGLVRIERARVMVHGTDEEVRAVIARIRAFDVEIARLAGLAGQPRS